MSFESSKNKNRGNRFNKNGETGENGETRSGVAFLLGAASVLVLALIFFGCVGVTTNPFPSPTPSPSVSPSPSVLPSPVPSASVAPNGGVVVLTDKRSYESGETVSITILNDGNAVKWLSQEPFFVVEKRAASGGAAWFEVFRPCPQPVPLSDLSLDPGQARNEFWEQVQSVCVRNDENPVSAGPGTYRIKIMVSDAKNGVKTPVYSETFIIKAAPSPSPTPSVSPSPSPTISPLPSPTPTVFIDVRSLEGNRELAKQFVLIESTFRNCGGMIDSLRLVNTFEQARPYSWAFAFNYTATGSGYGSCVLPALQNHSALIEMREGVVFSGVLDGKWDMIHQEMIG